MRIVSFLCKFWAISINFATKLSPVTKEENWVQGFSPKKLPLKYKDVFYKDRNFRTYMQQAQIKHHSITSRTPPVEYFKTRRRALVLCPLDLAAMRYHICTKSRKCKNGTKTFFSSVELRERTENFFNNTKII